MHLPGPLRAAVGLVVTAADEAKTLPDRAVELPMLAVSTALQLSLRAQQRYARLAARGDAVLNRQEPGQEPPEWATFDDPLSAEDLHRSALAQLDELVEEFGRASDSEPGSAEPDDGGTSHGPGLADIFGQAEPGPAVEDPSGDSSDESGESRGPGESDEADTATVTPISDAPSNARKSARKTSRKTPAKKAAAKKAPAKAPVKEAPARKAPAAETLAAADEPVATTTPAAKKAPAKKAPAKKAPAAKKGPAETAPAAKKAAAKKTADPGVQAAVDSAENGKQIDAPRHSAPSTSDAADD